MNVTRRARLLNHRALRDTTILNSPFSILNLFYKIKSSCPRFLLGQERIRSCGTTQIDANCVHSAHTSNNARSPDNGRSPRLATRHCRSLCPRKAIHTGRLCCDPTIHSSLKGDRTGYSSCSSVYLIALHYTHLRPNCQPKPARKFFPGVPTRANSRRRQSKKTRRKIPARLKTRSNFPCRSTRQKDKMLRTAEACRRPRRCR